jgi:O-antigen/teichoic acid export membrane protein
MQSLEGVITSEKIKVKSVAERVVSNFAWSVLSESLGKGLFFIATLYLARTLGVENFGLFTLAQTFTFYFWGAVDLGTNMYGIRELAKNKDTAEDIINPLLTLRITVGLAVFLLKGGQDQVADLVVAFERQL